MAGERPAAQLVEARDVEERAEIPRAQAKIKRYACAEEEEAMQERLAPLVGTSSRRRQSLSL